MPEEPPVTRAAAKEKGLATETEDEEDEPIPPKQSLKSKIGKAAKVSTPSCKDENEPSIRKPLKSKIGKNKTPTLEDDSPQYNPVKSNRAATPETADEEEPKTPARSIKSKIGGGPTPSKITSKIGGKKRLARSDDEAGERREKSVPPPVKEEEALQREGKRELSAAEKALEKRAQLKRELEEKRGREVKKARKF